MNEKNTGTVELQEKQQANSRRRRFLGAGSAAAPFLITLVSQPALGVQCFTPSRSLSRNTSLTQQQFIGECTGAESPGNYKAQQDPTGNAYHWPSSVPPSTLMHPLFAQGTSPNVTSFTKDCQTSTTTSDDKGKGKDKKSPSPAPTIGGCSMTLGEALNVNAPEQVHFHLIGAYLNKMGGNGAVIPDNVITAEGILAIWREYATKGFYEPVANVKWYADEIKNYLLSNGIVK